MSNKNRFKGTVKAPTTTNEVQTVSTETQDIQQDQDVDTGAIDSTELQGDGIETTGEPEVTETDSEIVEGSDEAQDKVEEDNASNEVDGSAVQDPIVDPVVEEPAADAETLTGTDFVASAETGGAIVDPLTIVPELTAEQLAAPAVVFAAVPDVPDLPELDVNALPEVVLVRNMLNEYAELMRVGRPQDDNSGITGQRFFIRTLKQILGNEGAAFGAGMALLIEAFRVHQNGVLSPEYRGRFMDKASSFTKKDLDFFNSFTASIAALATAPFIFKNMQQEIVLERVAAAMGDEGADARARLQEFFAGANESN